MNRRDPRDDGVGNVNLEVVWDDLEGNENSSQNWNRNHRI